MFNLGKFLGDIFGWNKSPVKSTPQPASTSQKSQGEARIGVFNQPQAQPQIQQGIDNRPYPMRVPGTQPTPQQQIQYAPKKDEGWTPVKNIFDFAKTLGSGIEQGVANIGDIGLMANAGIEQFKTDINPFMSNADKDKAALANYNKTELIRNLIKGGKTITGESLNPTPDFKFTGDFGRDAADLAGRGLNTGMNATMFIPAAGLAKNAVTGASQKVIPTILKNAGLFGGVGGVSSGLSTYGQTGDVGQSVKTGLQSGVTSAATQVGLGLLGHGAGTVYRDLKPGVVKVTTNLVNKAKNAGYEPGFIKVPGGKEPTPQVSKISKLESSNPTGTVFTDYNPTSRTGELGKNMTTLDKATGKKANELVTVYRGATPNQSKLVAGDFITTDKQLAQDYAGTGKVIEERIKYGDIVTTKDEWQGGEHIYRPTEVAPQVSKTEPYTGKKLTKGVQQILDARAKGNPQEALRQQMLKRQLTADLGSIYKDKPLPKELPIVGPRLSQSKAKKVLAKPQTKPQIAKQNLETPQRLAPETATNRLLPSSVDNPSYKGIIPQTETLQLSPAQAKQRFRKLNRDGTPFEIVNKDNSKPNKPFIAGEQIRKGGAEDIPDIDYTKFKDKSALGLGRETLERNLDRVAGSDAPKLKKFLVDTSRKNETDRVLFTNKLRTDTKKIVIDDLGIKPRSAESALTQKYGEKLITLNELKKASPKNWQNIKTASEHFRKQYDGLLDQWNAVRQEYGYDPVPKRQDYFRHFEDLSKTSNIVGIIKNSRDLPTGISGITDVFRPNKPFSNAELRRLGDKTTYDAVSGFDNYADSISRQIYHTDTVQRGRAIDNAIRKASETTDVELPNFVANLNEWTNLVSGKKTRIDRASEQLLGRKVYAASNWLKSRVGANMVGANISSALTNFIPLTQSLATTSKPSALRGLAETIGSAFQKDHTVINGVKSSFLTRRFPEAPLNMSKLASAARIPFEAVDSFSSKAIVAGKYFENVKKGMNKSAAMKAADEYAGKIITDRSVGQLPNLLETKTTGFLTQFQTEVNNQVSVLMRDIPAFNNGNKVKIASALAQVFLYSYLYNEAYSSVTGRRVAIDPIKFALDMADKDKDEKQKLGSFSDNILNALPGVSLIGGGGRLPIGAAMPDIGSIGRGVGNIGKDNDAAIRQIYAGVAGPAAYLGPKFGGGQAKKTVDDLLSQSKGYSETPSGAVRFPMPSDPLNQVRGAIFGQYSTPGGQDYIKNGIKPVGETDSKTMKSLNREDQQGFFEKLMADRATTTATNEEKAGIKATDKGITKLSDGTYYAKVGDKYETFKSESEAKITQDYEKAKGTDGEQIATYKYNLAKYEAGIKDGSITGPDVMTKKKTLDKEEITSQYPSEVKDFYQLSKANQQAYFDKDRATATILYDQAKLMDAKLVEKGLATTKFSTKATSSGGKSGSKSSGKSSSKSSGKSTSKTSVVKKGTKLDYAKGLEATYSSALANQTALRNLIKRSKITRKKATA